ncbi:amino acid adenylation domain-containing protein [Streptomyces sp. DSM 110735]|uniref:amino acid adenylation domain-containing protein n=1 Tax=Streptomyces sp. DSM 110735 TaxID=2775031 RepID=UPI0027DAF1A3|nr:amino acid adenylation domain-containing protein [Streptomyces sp. DSM 110735]
MSQADVADVYELSPLQQGMLLHTLYGGDADTYVAQRSFEITGALDADLLELAWRQVVTAHPALRTSFHWEGLDKPLQVVHRTPPGALTRHDWSDADADEQRDRFERLLAEDRATGFDPERPPLQRLRLIRLGEGRHGFVWTHHMLLLDGWSVPIVLGDFIRRYQCLLAGAPAPPAPAPYRDYIAWLQSQDMRAAQEWWTGALSGSADSGRLGPLLRLDPRRGPGAVEEVRRELPADLDERLRAVAARNQVTLSTLLQAAWALVLRRFSGDAEVTYGCTSSGRPAELRGVDEMVGSFINTLPIRITVPDDGPLRDWLREIQTVHSTARRYEYAPLARIRSWANLPGNEPLFESVVVLDNYPLAIGDGKLAEQFSVRSVNDFEKTSEALTLIVTPAPASVVRLVFHRERFEPGAVDDMMEYLYRVLDALTGAETVDGVLTAAAGAEESGPALGVRYPDAEETLAALIERQAAATPDAVAVHGEDGTLTYAQLLERSRRAADALAAAGAGPGRFVGVCAERGPDMVTGVLGTLLTGAAYLPLEPSLPPARLAFMASEAGMTVAFAAPDCVETAVRAGAERVLTSADRSEVPRATGPGRPDDAAYVLFTSGSTGRPKGVVVTHRAIVNRLLWMQETFPLGADDRVLQKTPLSFDVSVWELFWPLMNGATLVLARPGGHQDSTYLARVLTEQRVTVAHFVPSMLQLFLDEPVDAPALRRVMCSGEALPHPLVERFRGVLPHVELHNLYGPTEAAVDVTWWDCARPAPVGVVPIGDAVANTGTHVLDERLSPAQPGVPGELFLSGVQLARGYVNRPALTAERFVAHDLAGPGGRLYRTGDKVRRLRDGTLEFLGRMDHQVKIHGYRIELGEAEQVLLDQPSVREAVVTVRDGTRLAAYVTGDSPDPAVLHDALRAALPRYMVPATVTVLPAMPLTHNGKLDRGALPDPAPAVAADAVEAPASAREESIAEVFRDLLGLPAVNVTASFFDLGGDSFTAVRAVRRIEGASVGLLAACPSVRELAAALEATDEPGPLLRVTPRPRDRTTAHTLVCVPFGGGSAIGYQPLAGSLDPAIDLLAVALPGHELGGDPELRPLEEVAESVADEVLKNVAGPVSVYGHCVGVALAVEVVRRLETAGRDVERLFLGASYPYYGSRFARRRREGPEADQAELRYLQSLGGFGGVVQEDELAFVMRAFRHDAGAAQAYFGEHWPRRRRTEPLAAPITVVIGTDDPETPRYERRHRVWERFGSSVDLATVPQGGHYFLQQQPEILATVIAAALGKGNDERQAPRDQ